MIYHQIDDELVVYRVFETLNSRGLNVKWIGKTKSQLMALIFEYGDSAKAEAHGRCVISGLIFTQL